MNLFEPSHLPQALFHADSEMIANQLPNCLYSLSEHSGNLLHVPFLFFTF